MEAATGSRLEDVTGVQTATSTDTNDNVADTAYPEGSLLLHLTYSALLHIVSFLTPAESLLKFRMLTPFGQAPEAAQSNELWFLYSRARWNLVHLKYRPDKPRYWLHYYRQQIETKAPPKGRYSIQNAPRGVWSGQAEGVPGVTAWTTSINTDDNRLPVAELQHIPVPLQWQRALQGTATGHGQVASLHQPSGHVGHSHGQTPGQADDCDDTNDCSGTDQGIPVCDSCALAADMQSKLGHWLFRFPPAEGGRQATAVSCGPEHLRAGGVQLATISEAHSSMPALSSVFEPMRARRMSVSRMTAPIAIRERKDGTSRPSSRRASLAAASAGAHGLMHDGARRDSLQSSIASALAGDSRLPPVDVSVPGTSIDACPGVRSTVDGVVVRPAQGEGQQASAGTEGAVVSPDPPTAHLHLFLKLVVQNANFSGQAATAETTVTEAVAGGLCADDCGCAEPLGGAGGQATASGHGVEDSHRGQVHIRTPMAGCPLGVAAGRVRLITREGAVVQGMTIAGRQPIVAVNGDELVPQGADAVVLPVLGSAVLRVAFPLPFPHGTDPLAIGHTHGGHGQRDLQPGAVAALEMAGSHGQPPPSSFPSSNASLPLPSFHPEALEQCAGGRVELDLFACRPRHGGSTTHVSHAGVLSIPFRWDLEDAVARMYLHVAGGVVVRAERDLV